MYRPGRILAMSSTFNRAIPKLRTGFTRTPKTQLQTRSFSEEEFTRYCPGGYHPVRIGDVSSNGEYKILRKLGYGVYSTVWLARNLSTHQHVALKILTADSYGTEHDIFELEILKHIRAKGLSCQGAHHVLGLVDDFEHRGPHGKHVCLVSQAMGPDMSRYRRLFPKARLPLATMKAIARQLLLSLDFLHEICGIVHTDIKPQNILIDTSAIRDIFEKAPSQVFAPHLSPLNPPNDFYRPSEQLSSGEEDLSQATDICIRLADFGTASWADKHLTEWIQPQTLRAPEVILGATWDYKVDIWNVGLVIWELFERSLIFNGKWTAASSYSAEAHLAQMESILGSMPESLLARCKNRDNFFNAKGKLLASSPFPSFSLERICQNPELSDTEKPLFLDFIRSMVKLEPRERLSARELLKAEWLAFL